MDEVSDVSYIIRILWTKEREAVRVCHSMVVLTDSVDPTERNVVIIYRIDQNQ